MFKTLLSAVIGAVIVSAIAFYSVKSGYPFFLASQAARESLTVTPEQTLELRHAECQSDMTAFAIVGAGLVGLVSLCTAGVGNPVRSTVSLLSGLLLGALGGAGSGWIGHTLDLAPWFRIEDPIVYHVARGSLMMAPMALAAAFGAAIGYGTMKNWLNAFFGSILGVIASAISYALLMGVVSVLETRSKILPVHDTNRMMLIFLVVLCTCVGLLTVVAMGEKDKKAKTTKELTSSST